MALLSITDAKRFLGVTQIPDDQLQEILQLVEEYVWIICEQI